MSEKKKSKGKAKKGMGPCKKCGCSGFSPGENAGRCSCGHGAEQHDNCP